MENIEIAEALEEVADLLEIRGANPFRIRAYRNAVRTIDGLTRSLASMVEGGEDLTALPGIGKDMDAHIRELLATGGLTAARELAAEVPRELASLTRLDGVGPRKARKVWEELEVTTVDELEDALRDGRVETLEGFGRKSVEKILRAIEDHRRRQGRFLRTEAEQYVRPLLEHVRGAPGVERVEVAGSYRRSRETVGDVDMLVLLSDGTTGNASAGVMERFTGFPGVARVEAAGDTRGSVVLRSGLPVDLRILSRDSYGAALHYFTGSKEHNVAIRKLGVRRGIRISEYGIFRVPQGVDAEEMGPGEGERIGGATEEEVFGAVDLPFIPPVLREDRGELDAARAGNLPELVTVSDLRGDLHMHTTWSDGRESVRTMAEECRRRGYDYLAVTDHSRAVTVAGGLGPEELRAQAEEIAHVREEVEGIHILHGCEVDILADGSLDLPDATLEELDIVLIAVHSRMTMGRDEMTARIVRALEHPAADILVHPTGRLLTRRSPYPLDVEAVLQTAREHDVAVELNANPHRLDLHDLHLKRAGELGVRVSVATDAHRIADLEHMESGLEQGRRGWLESSDVLNALPLDELLNWLGRRTG